VNDQLHFKNNLTPREGPPGAPRAGIHTVQKRNNFYLPIIEPRLLGRPERSPVTALTSSFVFYPPIFAYVPQVISPFQFLRLKCRMTINLNKLMACQKEQKQEKEIHSGIFHKFHSSP
jgi:hypothetical protein